MNEYEAKRKARVDRFFQRAEKARAESDKLGESAQRMASVIPMGQPILVGHYSEKSDRNYRDRIWRKMGKSCEMADKAKQLESKAIAAENNTAISSDDPEAVTKLQEKIEAAEKLQATMRAANKVIKKKNVTEAEVIDGLAPLGFTAEQAVKLMKPDFCGRIGFADYQLSNNDANIHRMKQRLEQLQKLNQLTTDEITIGKVQLVQNAEINRLQVFFPGKPPYEVIQYLKRHGFHFSKFNGNAWQRQISNQATFHAKEAARIYNQLEG